MVDFSNFGKMAQEAASSFGGNNNNDNNGQNQGQNQGQSSDKSWKDIGDEGKQAYDSLQGGQGANCKLPKPSLYLCSRVSADHWNLLQTSRSDSL